MGARTLAKQFGFADYKYIEVPTNGTATLSFPNNGYYFAFLISADWDETTYYYLGTISGYTPARGKYTDIVPMASPSALTVSFSNGTYTFTNSSTQHSLHMYMYFLINDSGT